MRVRLERLDMLFEGIMGWALILLVIRALSWMVDGAYALGLLRQH